ncbi:MAG: ice-binding family protein [Ignavibacteriaceae bacterium]|nr:ice-binding family protein [Ignavibacteriaceae bacterium]
MNTMKYNFKIWALPLLLGFIIIAGCDERDGIIYPPANTIPPTVISTNPINTAIDVPLNQIITATFSKKMDASTITTATFTLMQGTTFVSGTVGLVDSIATYTPSSNLTSNTVYTATITTGAKDREGNALVNNYVWRFTTGTTSSTYTVTLSSNPVAGGTTSGGGTFNSGSSVTVTATPNSGYTFTNWTEGGNEVSTNANYQFTIVGNRTLVANFASPSLTYTVTLSSNPVAGGTTSGGGTFNSGSSVTVTATPNSGYTFTNWTEGGIELTTNANYQFTIVGNRALVANFEVGTTTYTVTLSSNPTAGGTTSGGGTFNSGSSVTVTATANSGYTFTNWIEDGTEVSTDSSYTFIITEDRTLVANFVVPVLTYTVTLSSNPVAGGTTSGGGTFNSGSSVTVTATPNSGYTFTNWTEGGIEVSTNANYQFTLVEDITLVANFDLSGIIIDLGSAATFGGIGGTAGMTNQGIFTVVNGNIGTTAASTLITGFHDTGGNVYTETPLNVGAVNGVINCAPPPPGTAEKFAIAQQALLDATTAFNYLAGLPGGSDPGAGELGGLVLAPGTYTSGAGTFDITSGDLTLDAQGDPNAIWVFQMASSLTVGLAGQPRSIILVNGAQSNNIFWQVGSAATINGAGGGTMEGTIISYSGVTFSTADVVTLTTLNGRALSLIGSVTLVNTVINVP